MSLSVVGEDLLTHGLLQELFHRGKEWVFAHWEKEGRPVTSIEIQEKLIGRHCGFVLVASISCPTAEVKYFAKIQAYRTETVMTHYLLKYINTGPEAFLIVMLQPTKDYLSHYMGIITLDVGDFAMASEWSPEFHVSTHIALSWSLLLSFLIALGHWTDIPQNKDNWGLMLNSQIPQELVVVDFSSNEESTKFNNVDSFLTLWKNTIASIPCDDSERIVIDVSMLRYKLQQFAWLESETTFKALLQRVMHKTEEWLHHTVKSETFTSICTCITVPASSDGPVLTAFQHTGLLCKCQVSYISHLLEDYAEWVARWNNQCGAMFKWMPFTKPRKVKYTVQVVVVKQRYHLRRRTVTHVYYA